MARSNHLASEISNETARVLMDRGAGRVVPLLLRCGFGDEVFWQLAVGDPRGLRAR